MRVSNSLHLMSRICCHVTPSRLIISVKDWDICGVGGIGSDIQEENKDLLSASSSSGVTIKVSYGPVLPLRSTGKT